MEISDSLPCDEVQALQLRKTAQKRLPACVQVIAIALRYENTSFHRLDVLWPDVLAAVQIRELCQSRHKGIAFGLETEEREEMDSFLHSVETQPNERGIIAFLQNNTVHQHLKVLERSK